MHSLLISCAELADLEPAVVRIFDCRFNLKEPSLGHQLYQKSHLPQARHADLEKTLSAPLFPGSGRHPLPNQADFTQFLRNSGVDDQHQVVVYDDSGGVIAARMWWMLHWVGHEPSAVLNGGWQQWTAENRLVNDQPPNQANGNLQAKPSRFKTANTQTVVENLQTQNYQILDARDTERFDGAVEPLDKKAGHIPLAKNLPFKHNLNPNHLFLTPTELQQRFMPLLKTHQAEQIVHMCGSGVTACHNLLAMCVAGHPPSLLYPNSWSGWIEDSRHPTVPSACLSS